MDKIKKKVDDKELSWFLSRVIKLSQIEFLGVLRLLNISFVIDEKKEKPEPQPFEDMISDLIDKYIVLSRTKRKNLNKIIDTARKQKE